MTDAPPTDRPRQRRGEGSKPVYVEARGAFRIRLPRPPGKRHQPTIYVRATGPDDERAEAEAWRQLRRAVTVQETSPRKRPADKRTTVGSWVRRYVGTEDEPGIAVNLRPTSRKAHRSLAKHLVRELGPIRLVDLTAGDVAAMLNRLEVRRMRSNRRYQVLSLLRVALDAAERDGRVPNNVGRLVPSPKRTRSVSRPPTPDEVRRVLEAAIADPVYGAMYAVCIATGVRQGEALALRWSDVRPDPSSGAPAIWIEATLESGTDHVGPRKAERDDPVIPLAPFAAEALERRRRWQLANGSTSSRGFVFTVPAGDRKRWRRTPGSPLRGPSALVHFNRLCDELGVGPYRWHDFRHEAASRMLRAGVDIKRVQAILGHADISTTARYLHSDADVRDALDVYAEARPVPQQ